MKAKILVKFLLVTLFFSTLLFLFAGRIDYYQGWLFLGTNMIPSLMNFLTVRNNTELIKERSKIGEGTKSWDKLLLGLSSLSYLVFLAVAGLDSGRYGWSPDFHWSLYVSGVVLTIVGQIIFLTAKKENKYFSTVVRIQTDRGHQVCQTGVYKIVRHPGYTGMIISSAALPLLTGSLWGIIPAAVSIILMIVRTYLEDNTLKRELAGYVEYSQVTRKRLIPKIW
jgi:protein-S-isoprenylcysteine O-methyltransferase Ste14